MADLAAWMEQHKALWTRAYDEVIAPNLEEQWKKNDQDHKTELKEKEENQQILFNHLNEEIQKTARLTKENEALKEELRRHNEAAEDMPRRSPAPSDDASALQEELRRLNENFSELTRKYQDVTQKAKYFEKKNQAVMQKNKDMKDSVRAWQEYADRQSGKQKPKTEARSEEPQSRLVSAYHLHEDRPHMPSSPGSIATVRTPASTANPGRSSPTLMMPLPQASLRISEEMTDRPRTPISNVGEGHRRSSNSSTPKPAAHPDYARGDQGTRRIARSLPEMEFTDITDKDERVYGHFSKPHPGSSQTTVDEPAERTATSGHHVEVEDDDDAPRFFSERSLKRKHGLPSKSRFEIYADRSSDGTPAKPYNVKEEPRSSPPLPVSTFLLRKETFDLDEPVPSILKTPLHTQKHTISHSNSTGTLRDQRSSSAPFSQQIKGEPLDPSLDANGISQDVLTPCHGDDELPLPVTDERAYSEPSVPNYPGDNILRSLDPNIPSNLIEESPHKRIRSSGTKGLAAHDVLAESGEMSEQVTRRRRLPPHLARAQLNQRIRAVKGPQTPLRSSLQTPKSEPTKVKNEPISTPSTRTSRIRRAPHTTGRNSGSKSRDDPTPSDRQIWTMRAPDSRAGLRKACGIAAKHQGRLRDRPHTELTIRDFKPNPAYNQGYSYAFSETVRKRGDRMCLPGCTNTQCCGSTFRALAAALDRLPASQEEALLEEYLGDAYNNMKLTQMSTEERQELVLQARTKKMAKESGKHREAYERRRTPPGFWRVDFPTTQEQQEDREKAKEMEKVEVQQRWLEAQRKGGKWLFRDE